MRILTGLFRGRIIEMPKGIRPTQQKVRKAIFDILSKRIKGAIFLELFAGSGAVGIEALSNGAKEVIFVEKDRDCLKILEKNLAKLEIKNYHIESTDVLIVIKNFAKENKRFDLIFLDPPYLKDSSSSNVKEFPFSISKKTLINISNYDILKPNGFVIIQHYRDDRLPDTLSNLVLYKQYKYADNLLTFYGKE